MLEIVQRAQEQRLEGEVRWTLRPTMYLLSCQARVTVDYSSLLLCSYEVIRSISNSCVCSLFTVQQSEDSVALLLLGSTVAMLNV